MERADFRAQTGKANPRAKRSGVEITRSPHWANPYSEPVDQGSWKGSHGTCTNLLTNFRSPPPVPSVRSVPQCVVKSTVVNCSPFFRTGKGFLSGTTPCSPSASAMSDAEDHNRDPRRRALSPGVILGEVRDRVADAIETVGTGVVSAMQLSLIHI